MAVDRGLCWRGVRALGMEGVRSLGLGVNVQGVGGLAGGLL